MTSQARPESLPADTRPPRVATRTLLACGALAGPLFVLAAFLEGATRAHYDPLRHPVSSLELGDHGWTQVVNFLVSGVLTLAFAVGLRRVLRPGRGGTWGPLLIGIWGAGLLGAGVFITDPVSGYPPGSPPKPIDPTVHGVLHDLVSLPAFVALTAACFVLCRRFAADGERGWALYSAVSGVVFLAAFLLSSAAFNQSGGLTDLGGVFQRVAIVVGWGWLSLLAVHLRRARPAAPGAVPSRLRQPSFDPPAARRG